MTGFLIYPRAGDYDDAAKLKPRWMKDYGVLSFQPNVGQSQYGQVRGLTAKNLQNMAEELACRSIDHEDDTSAG